MKQRVMIAIALVGEPDIIIADEPTTSLDVTIEAQILQILKADEPRATNTSVIIITHDLGVIARLCDRVLVMYGGKVMERGDVNDIFYKTAHPYTSGLMHSIARLDMQKDQELKPIEGSPPDLFCPPAGCPFAARCEYAMEICSEQPAPVTDLPDGHSTCCWLQDPHAPKVDLTYQGGDANAR
jgi:oligopeptide transport system ATP-binding protein